ncbi:MAG: Gfo/Idh/MocA family oxidoreductase [bacterium]|nr:Gfo/Idh/MocA family oxidoreductase [bacterium]
MMTEKLRVGILGAGMAGEGHIRAFAQQQNVEVTALWSRTRVRAETLAHQLKLSNLRVYDRWQDLIEQAEVDIISIATPETLRREPLTMALERGCHVLVEKPFSVELADAQVMAQAGRKTQTITTICFNWRYAPGAQIAWREVHEGRLGRLFDIRMEWQFRMTPKAVRERWPWVGSFLGGTGSHEFDRARFLTGSECTQIVSRLRPFALPAEPDMVVDDGAHMHLAELTGDIMGLFRVTLSTGQPQWNLVLNGEGGTLTVAHDVVVGQYADDDEPREFEIPLSDQAPSGTNMMQHGWNRLIADFVKAVRRGDVAHATVPHLPTLDDGLRNQEIIAAAGLSEKERRWVNVDELTS